MKNLELQNYGVATLSAREMRTTNGGIIPLLAIAVEVVCFGLAADIVLNFDYYSDRLKSALDNCKS